MRLNEERERKREAKNWTREVNFPFGGDPHICWGKLWERERERGTQVRFAKKRFYSFHGTHFITQICRAHGKKKLGCIDQKTGPSNMVKLRSRLNLPEFCSKIIQNLHPQLQTVANLNWPESCAEQNFSNSTRSKFFSLYYLFHRQMH